MRPRITPDEAQKLWNDYQSGDMYALANIMQGYYSDLFHWGLRLYVQALSPELITFALRMRIVGSVT
ncbi:hypothetical protein ACN9ML_08535 [Dyadobacter endophyticus]|uniref:hypothetical protein n=1 Tax=Dyadobacter endophyticus TaxID=1749036 RepID=UPI003CEA1317